MKDLYNFFQIDAVYEIYFPATTHWPEFTTILKFKDAFGYDGTYHFEILCPIHKKIYKEGHNSESEHIVYGYDALKDATIIQSDVLKILYGPTEK